MKVPKNVVQLPPGIIAIPGSFVIGSGVVIRGARPRRKKVAA